MRDGPPRTLEWLREAHSVPSSRPQPWQGKGLPTLHALARRLRRRRQQERGMTRSRDLADRADLIRHALDVQWRLEDQLGMHSPTLAELVAGAELLRAVPTSDLADFNQLHDFV